MFDRARSMEALRGRPWTSKPNTTLSSTVRQGNSESLWKTNPRSGPGRVTEAPSSTMSPLDLSISPSRMRRKVVFPQPLAPTMAANSPSSICRLMSRSASTSPPVALTKVFERPCVSSFGIPTPVLSAEYRVESRAHYSLLSTSLVFHLEVAPRGHLVLDHPEQLDQ